MSFTQPYTYIDAPTLAERVRAGDVAQGKVAIVDVRDDDFEGGAIKGARNVPSSSFQERVNDLVKDLVDVPQVVFHCHLSQQRGPKAARIYAEARAAALASSISQEGGPKAADEGTKKKEQEVIVLREGAAGFVRRFKDDKDLVENYDEEAWSHRE